MGDQRLSFAESENIISCFYSNTFRYFDSDKDCKSKTEKRQCRICQVEAGSYGQDLIELKCSCKEDLAFAHRVCAETWFKLKGNHVCEICHSVATNVASGKDVIDEEVVVEIGGGDAVVEEDGESWRQRRMCLSIVLSSWVTMFLIFFLQYEFK